MKRTVICFWLCMIAFAKAYTQDDIRNFDLIIVIDGEIAAGSISSPKIELVSESTKKILNANYYPGNFSLTSGDYITLMSDSTSTFNLNFTYYEYLGQKQLTYTYEIELKREWLKDYFNILRIYNLNKEKNKGYSSCGPGKNYAYGIESPSHTTLPIRTKS